ncbi:MAG: hypothetical protein ACRBG0_11145 [Lewinella sp.]|jgi:hypothetical protein|uniref:hypothetical protein n=1 Tax=Lewinella sp. TaxID=2004506 RepID=UPI003D6C3C4D
MSTEENRQLLDLQYLEGIFKEHDINVLLIEKSEQSPLNYLIAPFPSAPDAPESSVQLIYIPTQDTLEETNLLQFFAYLSEEAVAKPESTNEFLHYLNLRTPIGYFGVTAEGGLFYRYVHALPRFQPPNKETFLDTFTMFSSTFVSFGPLILSVAQGKMDLEVAKRQVGG